MPTLETETAPDLDTLTAELARDRLDAGVYDDPDVIDIVADRLAQDILDA